MSGINARTQYELNGGSEQVKNATYWKRQHDKLADRIAELEKQVEHYKNKAEYLDKRELELLAEIARLEKDLHMVQRHYDQLNIPDSYVVVCVHCAKELKIEFDEFQVLTDNEILQIYADVDGGGIIKFARAVESRLSAKIAKYEEVLHAIANDYHELSDHKIEVQVRNHKKWAREALE